MSREEAKLLSRKGEDMAKAVGLNVPMSRLKRLRQWSIDRYERDQRAEKQYVYDKGMEKGMEKGMQAVALNMLKEKADTNFICKVTGLSVDEIKNLKNGSI